MPGPLPGPLPGPWGLTAAADAMAFSARSTRMVVNVCRRPIAPTFDDACGIDGNEANSMAPACPPPPSCCCCCCCCCCVGGRGGGGGGGGGVAEGDDGDDDDDRSTVTTVDAAGLPAALPGEDVSTVSGVDAAVDGVYSLPNTLPPVTAGLIAVYSLEVIVPGVPTVLLLLLLLRLLLPPPPPSSSLRMPSTAFCLRRLYRAARVAGDPTPFLERARAHASSWSFPHRATAWYVSSWDVAGTEETMDERTRPAMEAFWAPLL